MSKKTDKQLMRELELEFKKLVKEEAKKLKDKEDEDTLNNKSFWDIWKWW